MSYSVEELVVGAGLVGSEQGGGDSIAHDLSAITGDGKDLGVDMIMELFDVILELL